MVRRLLGMSAVLLLAGGLFAWFRTSGRSMPQVTEIELQGAADGLLESVNPALPSNTYFPAYAKEKLAWLNVEHAAGRLDVRFFHDTRGNALPADVVMASMREGGMASSFCRSNDL